MKCSADCRKTDSTNNSPAKALKKAMPTASPDVNARLRSRLGSISGVPWPRRSTTMKSPNNTTPPASMTKIHAGQSSSRPCTSG